MCGQRLHPARPRGRSRHWDDREGMVHRGARHRRRGLHRDREAAHRARLLDDRVHRPFRGANQVHRVWGDPQAADHRDDPAAAESGGR
jgi:hypothetical protein